MTSHICAAHDTQQGATSLPLAACRTCENIQQYIPWVGQQWTIHADLLRDHSIVMDDDDDVLSLAMASYSAVNQHAVLMKHSAGHTRWKSLSHLADVAVAEFNLRRRARVIAIFRTHLTASMVELSDAQGDISILLHSQDRQWVSRDRTQVGFWPKKRFQVNSDLSLARCTCRVPGSTGLRWKQGACGGTLLTGESIQIDLGRRQPSVMRSYRNAAPVKTNVPSGIRRHLRPHESANAYGFMWSRNIIGDAQHVAGRSFRRNLNTFTI